jgi:hypothetical protein
MKTLLALAIIISCTIKVNAQTALPAAPKNNNLFKLKPIAPLDTNLFWHMPKTPNVLKQLPGLQFYNKPTVQLPDPNDLLVYSTMPIRHLTGFSKMPIIGLTTGDNMPVKKVTIIYPLDVVTP